jgi:hypothetical protein
MLPIKFYEHFGLPIGFLDSRFLFLGHLSRKQLLDLARNRQSNFHGQCQNTLGVNTLMELVLEGTCLADHLLLQSGATGTAPGFFLGHCARKASLWPPLSPVPGFGPNASLLFQNHIYPPAVDVE